MRCLRFFLVFVTLFALAAQVAAAQEEKGDENARDAARREWERMTPEERRQVLEARDTLQKMPEAKRKDRREDCEALMQADSEQDRREIIERLKRVRMRVERDRLGRLEAANARFRKALPAKAQAKLDGLEDHFQQAIYGYAFGRTFQVMREQIEEKLSPEERKKLDGYRGPEWWKHVYLVQMKWIMEELPEEERRAIDALPREEQDREKKALFWKQAKKNGDAARKVVAKEVADLLDAPAGKLQAALSELWGYRTIRDPARREAAFRSFRNKFCRGRHHR